MATIKSEPPISMQDEVNEIDMSLSQDYMNGSVKILPTDRLEMIPPYYESKLEDLALDFATRVSGLANQLPLAVRQSLGTLVRTMNCYYSYLLEECDIPPRDIEDLRVKSPFGFSVDHQRWKMQRMAKAFLHVEQIIDFGQDKNNDTTSAAYLTWLHYDFCRRLPPNFFQLLNQNTVEFQETVPGELKTGFFEGDWPHYQDRFNHARGKIIASKVHRIATLGAAFHRLLWVQPFSTCNRQIALLLSHATLQRCGVPSSLWSLARGLKRNCREIDALFLAAGFQEGKNNILSTLGLAKFCEFFLTICIKEIDFMASLFEPRTLLHRMSNHIDEEVRVGKLRKGSFQILREALLVGEVSRSSARNITGNEESTTRKIVSGLRKNGYLQSETAHSPLVLTFPIDAIEPCFPGLYPHMTV